MNDLKFLNEQAIFTTREFALKTKVSLEQASRKLHRLTTQEELTKVTRGIWAQPNHPLFTPYGATPYILGKEQGYVSFLTALHRHGAISQIPARIQIATSGRGRTLESPIGYFELFHLQPRFMRYGFEVFDGKVPYNLATPEKALLDTIYLSLRKGKRFTRFPELDKTVFKKKTLVELLKLAPPKIGELTTPHLKQMGLQ